ncbi:hypothetical protein BC831DRAFT_443723 [Entophlyctis helioformis]|nr:hypothetical protein BC831DRAFT_443723 [Entophlyctis helioformis]
MAVAARPCASSPAARFSSTATAQTQRQSHARSQSPARAAALAGARTTLALRTYSTEASAAPTAPASSASTPLPPTSINAGAGGPPAVTVSERAAKQILAINTKDGTQHALRVMVDSGGCHGFQYKMELTAQTNDDDLVFERDGARVVIDAMSLDMLNGSTVDFVDELIGSSFQIVGNPNAETSCGCKTSFNLKG